MSETKDKLRPIRCSCLTDERDEIHIAIPRAQYEAYRLAVRGLLSVHGFSERVDACWNCPACAAIAALRAAGIDPEEKT